jgi:hypothetical protein
VGTGRDELIHREKDGRPVLAVGPATGVKTESDLCVPTVFDNGPVFRAREPVPNYFRGVVLARHSRPRGVPTKAGATQSRSMLVDETRRFDGP